MKEESSAQLRVYAAESFIPVVSAFAEKSALAFGLAEPEALGLCLAAEEVFGHLCRVVLPHGGWVEVRCSGGGYYIRADFAFPAVDFDMRAFNITATPGLADEADFDQLGLLLASRSVDHFEVAWDEGQGLKLTLIKEKAYAPTPDAPVGLTKQLDSFRVRAPSPEELKLFAHLVNTHYRGEPLPPIFGSAGKLVDMVGGGEYQAVVAVGPAGELGGGALWVGTGSKAVEWFGPYTFGQPEGSQMPGALLDHCIGAIARTPAVVLLNRFATSSFPKGQFECLGRLTLRAQDGSCRVSEAWARLMDEDPGSVAWLHPELEGFARREFARLILPREVRPVADEGERHAPHSVLLTTFDRLQGSATLKPVWYGADFEANLARHLELFRSEGICTVLFALDLGLSWQAGFAPGVLRAGFVPSLLLPYAGAGDVVIFQRQEEAAS